MQGFLNLSFYVSKENKCTTLWKFIIQLIVFLYIKSSHESISVLFKSHTCRGTKLNIWKSVSKELLLYAKSRSIDTYCHKTRLQEHLCFAYDQCKLIKHIELKAIDEEMVSVIAWNGVAVVDCPWSSWYLRILAATYWKERNNVSHKKRLSSGRPNIYITAINHTWTINK